jgi:hypothetical protein
MDIANTNMVAGWIAMLSGAVSGAILGLFFAREAWAGGYASFRRRMLRLGHISFFGIGFLNLLFGFTLAAVVLPPAHSRIASVALLVAAIAMPACCFLSAWKKSLRHLFPVPVLAVLTAIVAVLLGWPRA